ECRRVLFRSLRKMYKIFISHLHGDHIFRLPGLISSRSFFDGNDQLTIYGPKGIQQFIETALTVSDTHLSYTIAFEEITEAGVVFEDDHFIVDTMFLDHGVPSL